MMASGGTKLHPEIANTRWSDSYLPSNSVRAQLEELARRHASRRCELQEIMRRQGGARWVHVICAFFDAEPEAGGWLACRPPGLHSRQTEPKALPAARLPSEGVT